MVNVRSPRLSAQSEKSRLRRCSTTLTNSASSPSQLDNEQLLLNTSTIVEPSSSAPSSEFKLNETVWAKVNKNPYWPAIIIKMPTNASKQNYKVRFFYGSSQTKALVNNANLKPFDCETTKEELKSSSSKKKNADLERAIAEAEMSRNNKQQHLLIDSSNISENVLPTIDEELKMINHHHLDKENNEPRREESSSDDDEPLIKYKMNNASSRRSKSESPATTTSSSKTPPPPQQSIKKKQEEITEANVVVGRRVAAISASQNLSMLNRKSDLQLQKEKLSAMKSDELQEAIESSKKAYEACKSIKFDFNQSLNKVPKTNKKESNRKRARLNQEANEKENVDENSLSNEMDEKRQKQQQQQNDEIMNKMNCSSRSSSPISINFDSEDEDDETLTLLVNTQDSNKTFATTLIPYLIERLNEFHKNHHKKVTVSIYDVASPNEDDGLSEQQPGCSNKNNNIILDDLLKRSKLSHVNVEYKDFNAIFTTTTTKLVISLLKPCKFALNELTSKNNNNVVDRNVQVFEEALFASDRLDGIVFISLAKFNYANAIFYHYFFKDNNAVFVEAPITYRSLIMPAADDENKKTAENRIINEYMNGFESAAGLLNSDNSLFDDQDKCEIELNNKNLCIYASCMKANTFQSVKYILDAFVSKPNVTFKGCLGLPNYLISLSQPLVYLNSKFYTQLICSMSNQYKQVNPIIDDNEKNKENQRHLINQASHELKNMLNSTIDVLMSRSLANLV